jgi:mannose-6-phosphate isomerase-like protein (cupin superfamily)
LSLQYHDYRSERWTPLDQGVKAQIGEHAIDLTLGVCYTVMQQQAHRLWNPTNRVVRVLEVAVGKVDESDIVRLSDQYGRIDKMI